VTGTRHLAVIAAGPVLRPALLKTES